MIYETFRSAQITHFSLAELLAMCSHFLTREAIHDLVGKFNRRAKKESAIDDLVGKGSIIHRSFLAFEVGHLALDTSNSPGYT